MKSQSKTEIALKESEKRYSTKVMSVGDGVIATDLKGAKLPDFWQVPEDRRQYLNELIAHGFIRNYMVNAKKINGEKIDVMMNSHLVKDEKGGLVRIDGTFTDFTERRQAEQLIK